VGEGRGCFFEKLVGGFRLRFAVSGAVFVSGGRDAAFAGFDFGVLCFIRGPGDGEDFW